MPPAHPYHSDDGRSSSNNDNHNSTVNNRNGRMDHPDNNGFELEFVRGRTAQGRPPNNGSNHSRDNSLTRGQNPIDLDTLEEFFAMSPDDAWDDDAELFTESKPEDDFKGWQRDTFFNNPSKRLLDEGASLIPGSPFSKPPNRPSNRPTEPLAIARYASGISLFLTIAVMGLMIFWAVWNYTNIGRILVTCILSIFAFFGLFWNTYFVVASILKCFIPAKAFTTNTKYCSIIPEEKPELADWLHVTIQIPVYKESLQDVMRPTLKSCIKARDYYERNAKGAVCNIVMCDDGMMAMLRDRFPAAEMLWKSIQDTQGQVLKLSQLLTHVPRESRRHLKGLNSKNVFEVFYRMLFYYHYKIGFVARSTVDRRGKFKKASNLNSHLRLALGAIQRFEEHLAESLDEALHLESHNPDGSRYVMFGNNVKLGHLICVNDADARMAESVIFKTVPEFLNDNTLGFTQHATKTMKDQRGESYYINMLAVYTDALYQGHFLLSSILGCHPPLVGHSIFLRTEAVRQCGRLRTMRKAYRWLRNIGIPFLPVDQIGFSNLNANSKIEYWSECHVSEDFELMIHLYNLGFNGRYVAYPNCEFEEGITRNFDEEAGRHRKFALGAHELVFNAFQDMVGHGVFTDLFRTFLTCDIPSYYKIFLTAYLCSYTSGGTYLIVFVASAIAQIVNSSEATSLLAFSPAGVIILSIVVFYVIGYSTFLFALVRMYINNRKLFFPEYRKKYGGVCYLILVHIRYCMLFQFLFYTVMNNWYFLGSMDHMLAKAGVVSATNKDAITTSRCVAFIEMVKFNIGSWGISLVVAGLAYTVVLQDFDWDYTHIPTNKEWIQIGLFSGPAILLALFTVIIPIILNPYILGWPFYSNRPPKSEPSSGGSSRRVIKDSLGRPVTIDSFIDRTKELDKEIERANQKPDLELGSLATHDLQRSPNVTPKQREENLKVLNKKWNEKVTQKQPQQQQRSRPSSRSRGVRFPTPPPSDEELRTSSHHRSRGSNKSKHVQDV